MLCQPARLHRLAESIPGLLKKLNIPSLLTFVSDFDYKGMKLPFFAETKNNQYFFDWQESTVIYKVIVVKLWNDLNT